MYEIDQTVLREARQRIAEERKCDVKLTVTPPPGTDLNGAKLSVRLTRHWFRFGCNAFGLGRIESRNLQRAYEQRYARLLNYATLPFYWAGYEPRPGRTYERRVRQMARWCADHDVAAKGHPLTWHETFPSWAEDLDDARVLELQRQRISELVGGYRGLVDTWDVINEATVGHRVDNAIGRWIAREGAGPVVAEVLRLAREANLEAELLYNDFNLRTSAYPDLATYLLEQDAPVDALGLQSHMHVATWPLEEAWTICERYARYGLPLHFTELTILSGRAKDPRDTDWHRVHADWPSTPEAEEAQAAYGEALYTVLYSHPAVEAITWWDFSDYQAWQGAPAGMLRKDMSPKPLYERLLRLIWGEWATHAEMILGQTPQVVVPCALGEHAVEVELPSGEKLAGDFELAPGEANPLRVELA